VLLQRNAELIAAVRPRVPIAILAALASLSICCSCGLVGDWGRWYSHDLAYRRQTDAFQRGEIALSRNPSDLDWDMAWSEGGVHQVWGLGVPAWRLPFELLARAVGQPAFPDRFALVIAIGLSAYIVIASLLPAIGMTATRQWICASLMHPERMITGLLLIVFPPILGLCRGPFNVYEEPVVYGFYYAIGLFASTIALMRNATPTRYVINGVLAGVIGFVRPTFFVYGIATVLAGMRVARSERWSLCRVMIAPSLLLVGGLALFASNARRFGNGFEFGHRLNATAPDIIYASRFGASFNQQALWRRGLEVLGSLYFVRKLNGADNFQAEVVRWQLPTARSRRFYSRTFDGSHLSMCLGSIVAVAWATVSQRRSNMAGVLLWIALPCAMLAAFYVMYYPISSRYMLDFAPAMAAAAASLMLLFGDGLSNSRNALTRRWILAASFTLWWAVEMALTRNVLPSQPAWGQIHVTDAMGASERNAVRLPKHYVLGSKSTPSATGVHYNGFGWDEHTGTTGPVVMLFVENLAELRLECRWGATAPISPGAIGVIRAKVGLEELTLKAVTKRAHCWELAFLPPVRPTYRRGIQPVFISFVRPDEILAGQSPWRLQRVEWRDPNQRRNIYAGPARSDAAD
jgi:hypothetical protein